MDHEYHDIPADQVPPRLRWDVPRRNQGQIVEVAYADATPEAGEAGPGSPYRRTTDTSIVGPGRVTYASRVRIAHMDMEVAARIATSLNDNHRTGMLGRLAFAADGTGGCWFSDGSRPETPAAWMMRIPHTWVTARDVLAAVGDRAPGTGETIRPWHER